MEKSKAETKAIGGYEEGGRANGAPARGFFLVFGSFEALKD